MIRVRPAMLQLVIVITQAKLHDSGSGVSVVRHRSRNSQHFAHRSGSNTRRISFVLLLAQALGGLWKIHCVEPINRLAAWLWLRPQRIAQWVCLNPRQGSGCVSGTKVGSSLGIHGKGAAVLCMKNAWTVDARVETPGVSAYELRLTKVTRRLALISRG